MPRVWLGKAQVEVLRRLEDGPWSAACGWHWNTPHQTRLILNSLVRRGLVTKVHIGPFRQAVWRLNRGVVAPKLNRDGTP
jgi:hypothetical protein